MTLLAELTERLAAHHTLTDKEVDAAAAALTGSGTADEEKAGFLSALAEKGETAGEVAAFARAFRERAIDPGVEKWADRAIDVVGTGGDHAGAFNISSMVVFTLASAGVPVMKHGNRGITSKCGSADLLTGLGVNIEAPPEKLRDSLDQLGFAFFYAPAYHPAFRHIAPARKLLAAQGRRTIFNILGPLINPGRPAHILLGVFSQKWVPLLAEVHTLLGTRAGLSAHSIIEPADAAANAATARGIDELTTTGPNRVRGIGRLADMDGIWRATDHGLSESPLADLLGGDLEQNLAIVEALLAGRAPAGLAETIVFNAATALWITGKVDAVADGAGLARELLLGGAVKARIAATREFYHA
ncbi:MAG: anthranilate phosphoribosyltransferase [Opitutaceae bacterium]|jgi:anthranilate phosphoribosyltransferase|nr:anthranilate phosphoribosyltransferase [Opitutaceae bacterium]